MASGRDERTDRELSDMGRHRRPAADLVPPAPILQPGRRQHARDAGIDKRHRQIRARRVAIVGGGFLVLLVLALFIPNEEAANGPASAGTITVQDRNPRGQDQVSDSPDSVADPGAGGSTTADAHRDSRPALVPPAPATGSAADSDATPIPGTAPALSERGTKISFVPTAGDPAAVAEQTERARAEAEKGCK